jgi:protein-S-isoprenylcysteine O-methyltransferase Ste14
VVDAYMVQPKDGYWQAGCLALGRFSEVDRKKMVQYCLDWLVKGYFIPYITPILAPDVRDVVNSAFVKGSTGFSPFYDFAYSLAFTIDVVFASLGYLMTLRVADTHIRTTEPTTMGWLVCIMCYPPFSKTFYAHYYSYESNTPYWGNWTSSVHPLFYWTWGMAIVVCLFFYAWTSITFGCRFSNLTNRGILTNGPFRLTKHPHYVFKNISWWLVVVPFVSKTTSLEAMRACLMLAAFNFIYFMRARTEERHLSQDPAYVAYALWINDNGLFSWLGRILPFLRYKPPAGVKGDADILPHRRAVS